MNTEWSEGRRVIDVPCTLDIEQTPESFHAYAVPENVEIQPGDIVLVHDAPAQVSWGAKYVRETRASVARAGFFARCWTRFTGLFLITDLYEVGFEPPRGLS